MRVKECWKKERPKEKFVEMKALDSDGERKRGGRQIRGEDSTRRSG